MNKKSWEARLKRVESQLPAPTPGVEFIRVDQSFLVEWDELSSRWSEVRRREFWATLNKEIPSIAAHRQERYEIEARHDEMARSLPCPLGYGVREDAIDRARMAELNSKQNSSPKSGGHPWTKADQREFQQCVLRRIAYTCTFEHLARGRMNHLYDNYRLSAAEQQEYDDLQAIYQPVPREYGLFDLRAGRKRYYEVLEKHNLTHEEDQWGFDRLRQQEYIAKGRKMMASIPTALLKYFR